MTATEHASRLITLYGATEASEMAGRKVRKWAELATTTYPFGGPTAMQRVRHWLAVDHAIHFNRNIPEVPQ